MGLFKKIKKGVKKVVKVASKVAPVAAAFLPGVGPLAAAGIGAGLSKIGGSSWKSALGNGLMSAAGSVGGKLARGGSLGNIFGSMNGALGSSFSGGGLSSLFGGGPAAGMTGTVANNMAPGMNNLSAYNPATMGSQGGGGIDWGSAFSSFLGGPQGTGMGGMGQRQPQQMGGMEALFGGLGGLYQGYKQGQSLDNQRQTLDDLYSFNSPYAQQMRSTLERKDAAAGRRSQYGTREVELMGDLAGKRAAAANSMFNIGQAQDQNRFNTLSNSMNYGMASGALQGVGRGLSNLYDQYQGSY